MEIISSRKILFTVIAAILMSSLLFISSTVLADDNEQSVSEIESIDQDENVVTLSFTSGVGMEVTFIKDNLFRLYVDPENEFQEDPTSKREEHIAKIVDKDTEDYAEEYGKIDVDVEDEGDKYRIATKKVALEIDKETSIMRLINLQTNEILWEEAEPLKIEKNKATQTLQTKEHEYFYGGGQQNG